MSDPSWIQSRKLCLGIVQYQCGKLESTTLLLQNLFPCFSNATASFSWISSFFWSSSSVPNMVLNPYWLKSSSTTNIFEFNRWFFLSSCRESLNQLFLFFHHFTIYVTAKKGFNNNVIQQIYLHTEIPLNQHFPFIHDFNNYVTANMPKRVPTIMIYNRLSFVDKYIENSVNKLHKTKQVNR